MNSLPLPGRRFSHAKKTIKLTNMNNHTVDHTAEHKLIQMELYVSKSMQ
jgi:hypothetical protein